MLYRTAKTASKAAIILTLSLILARTTAVADSSATADVNFRIVYQRLEGFGAAGVHYTNWLTAHPLKNEIYDVIFGKLGLDIFRIENVYDHNDAAAKISQWAEIIGAARDSLGHPVKIMITSGSPPAYLKSNGDTKGGTLARDANGAYRYSDFAKWWADSLASYSNNDINVEYLSIQNEPDYLNLNWDTCKFTPSQTSQWAGYNQAFEAVYKELHYRTVKTPKLLVPETIGFGGSPAYIDALTDPNHIYGYAHHLYGDGDYHYPDSFIAGMQSFASGYGSRPILQTEFTCGDPCDFNTAIRLAVFIHNSLVYEGVTSYCYWDLFWGDTGGLVTIQFPWRTGADFTINPAYYAFKQYTKFTDPGFSRVKASVDSNDLRISAFREPHTGNVAIVIINVSDANDVNLSILLNGLTPETSEIHRTSLTERFAFVGSFNQSTPLLLPRSSITTIHLTGIPDLADCNAVQSWGFGFLADINLDCYIDYEDLRILAEYWLRNDCNSGNNYCDKADIDNSVVVDFADFGLMGTLWMQCDDPCDFNCSPILF